MTIKEKTKIIDRRAELLGLCEEIYGRIPKRPEHLTVETVSEDRSFAAGKATEREMRLIFDFGANTEALTVKSVIPNSDGEHPAILFIDNDLSLPGKYLPAEEITDRGYAIFLLSFNDVRESRIKRSSVLATEPCYLNRGQNPPGELALLAWTAMRVVDLMMKLDCVSKDKIIISGHGLLGRAALLIAANDQRIGYVIANDSLSMGLCEDAAYAVRMMPELFTEEFPLSDTDSDPHGILLSLCADRRILIGVAEDDARSNPEKELGYLLSLIKSGMPKENISYHSRSGSHYLSRDDWRVYLDYIDGI